MGLPLSAPHWLGTLPLFAMPLGAPILFSTCVFAFRHPVKSWWLGEVRLLGPDASPVPQPKLVPEDGLEPPTTGLLSRCSWHPTLRVGAIQAIHNIPFPRRANLPAGCWHIGNTLFVESLRPTELLGRKVAPHEGFEPPTHCFRDSCSVR